jgi:pyridoxine 5-phosphate synthase
MDKSRLYRRFPTCCVAARFRRCESVIEMCRLAAMIRLGVNIDHVATLREARYRGVTAGPDFGLVPEPDPVLAAAEAEAAGAHGITVHLREDRRHIQDRDVWALRKSVHTSLNLEMADTPGILAIAEELKPDEVCMVPEKRQEVTTEGGLDVAGAASSLASTVARLRAAGIVVSMFVDPDPAQIRASAHVGAQYIELHTGTYAHQAAPEAVQRELAKLTEAALLAHELGLGVNAGHGLNYKNTKAILSVPHLETLNIGHAIVARSVTVGLRRAVREMLEVIGA